MPRSGQKLKTARTCAADIYACIILHTYNYLVYNSVLKSGRSKLVLILTYCPDFTALENWSYHEPCVLHHTCENITGISVLYPLASHRIARIPSTGDGRLCHLEQNELKVAVRVRPLVDQGRRSVTVLYKGGDGQIAVVDPKHCRPTITQAVRICIVRCNDWREKALALAEDGRVCVALGFISRDASACDSCCRGLAIFMH